MWMNRRVEDRIERNVLGKNEKLLKGSDNNGL